jgi:hypothetical protein
MFEPVAELVEALVDALGFTEGGSNRTRPSGVQLFATLFVFSLLAILVVLVMVLLGK